MGETRDPRVDPRAGDVLRWMVEGTAIVVVLTPAASGGVDAAHVDLADGETWSNHYSLGEWRNWDGVDGGIDGVQVLYRAEVFDGG